VAELVSALRLYGTYTAASIRSQMQFRISFLLGALGSFCITIIEFAGIWAMFNRFGTLGGWALPDVALLYGMINVSFALADATSTGFDRFGQMVGTGEFDRLLIRPRTTLLQLAGQELTLRRVGRLLQGALVLYWATTRLSVHWNMAKVLLLLASILGGACTFYGTLVLQALISFWTIESLEMMNVIVYGGVEAGQYPLHLYRPAFRRFFTGVVPLACANYFPAHAILSRPEVLGTPAWVHWLSPVVGPVFLWVMLSLWPLGVRHYGSSGS
jgi:ABC-2 type transport system permease protein